MTNKAISYTLLLLLAPILTWSQISFKDVADEKGLERIYGPPGWSGGVSVYDFNKDGYDDITFSTPLGDSLHFYENNGCCFVKKTAFVGNSDEIYHTNWVDIDNDGDKDLFVTSYQNGLRLYINSGQMVFNDISSTCGIATSNIRSFSSSIGDYNKDGFLDIYVSTWVAYDTISNILYRNNGNNTFTDVTKAAGLWDTMTYSHVSTFWDYDKDGWPDIFATTDKVVHPEALYRNNGNGTFTNVTVSSGTNLNVAGMSATVDDYNNDGYLDFYMTNTPPGNVLYHNNGNGTFTDTAKGSGVQMNTHAWGAAFLDAENDGDLDLYVSSQNAGLHFPSSQFYQNTGNGMFQTYAAIGMEDDTAASFGSGIGDFNNDGRIDVVVTNRLQNNYLWENRSNAGNYIKILLEGTISNKDATGCFIYVYTNGNQQMRYTMNGESFIGQFSQDEIVGVGSNTMIDSIVIDWLSGIRSVVYNVPVNQKIKVVEGPMSPYNLSIAGFNYGSACQGDSIEIRALNDFDNYLWNTGDTTKSIYVKNSGTYSLSAANGSAISSNHIDVVIPLLNEINLGNDTSICEGDVLRLQTNNTLGCALWSDKSKKEYLDVSESGQYWVQKNNLGCQRTDTISIRVMPIVELNLGNDTIICAGDSLFLNAGGNWSEYLWSDNSTDSVLVVVQSGNYSVDVKDEAGCVSSGEITVYVSPCLFVPELDKERALNIFPNPGSDLVNVSYLDEAQYIESITVYALTGEVIQVISYSGKENMIKLPTSDLNSGYYVLEVSSNKGRSRKSLLINK